MALRMVVEGNALGDSVFEADMDPSDVRRLAAERPPHGSVSVIVVDAKTLRLNGRLEFDFGAARVLQVGDSPKTFFIAEESTQPNTSENEKPSVSENFVTTNGSPPAARSLSRDDYFISRLPEILRTAGEKLMKEVRRVYPGSLIYHETSKRYVESPDNFWAVQIQPRVGELEITVRGHHWEFSVPDGLTLKSGRRGYSTFKISRPEHVDGALRILAQARKH